MSYRAPATPTGFHLPAPTGWAGNPRLFDAARFWHTRCFGEDKPQLQQKAPKALQVTQERWQIRVRQVDGEGGRDLPSKQTMLLVLEVSMVEMMRMRGRSWAAYSHHLSLGHPFLPAPYFPIAEGQPAARGDLVHSQPASWDTSTGHFESRASPSWIALGRNLRGTPPSYGPAPLCGRSHVTHASRRARASRAPGNVHPRQVIKLQ